MSNWEVTIKQSEIYIVNVEADSEEEATEKAMDAIGSELGKYTYHNDSDGEVEVVES